MISGYLYRPEGVDETQHILATYSVRSKNLLKAAEAIAIGQSIGNPNKRPMRETPRMMRENLAKIIGTPESLANRTEGTFEVAYPIVNFDIKEDGITQLLCTLMGGQMDIDTIEACRLRGVRFPQEVLGTFQGPKFGLYNIQQRAKAIGRPLLGGIVKPKTGITVNELEELVGEMVRGGVDFIKEDEILGNPAFCKFKDRVPRVLDIVNNHGAKEGREIFYAPCINADYPYFLDRAEFAAEHGAKVVHLNIHAGLPAYRALRDLDLPSAIFFQKSGDKVLTAKGHAYGIDWPVVCQLARMMGSDFIHAGMWGGYLSDTREDMKDIMNSLKGENGYNATVPSLSCGSHPGLVETTVRNFGTDLMMSAGGAVQAHPMGSEAGARAMRQAMECTKTGQDIYSFMQTRPELKVAIEKDGYSNPDNGELMYKKAD